MFLSPAFVAPFVLPPRRHFPSSQRAPCRRAPAFRRYVRVTPAATGAPSRGPTVTVGDIVAVKEGNRVSVARVTGVASSGDTVDISVLEEFVRELYVDTGSDETYAFARSVRPVRAEWVPSQEGWIVLNQDLDAAKAYFESKPAGEPVVVEEAPKKELSPEALEKQGFPKPTRRQAFFGALFCLPLAALFYAVFASARDAYRANPGGEELLSGAVFRQIVMFTTFAGSVASLVVGCALLIYFLQYNDEGVASETAEGKDS